MFAKNEQLFCFAYEDRKTSLLNYKLFRFFILSYFLEVAIGLTRNEIHNDWEWLTQNLFEVLNDMESEDEVTNFTMCKIKSLHAQNNQNETGDTADFKVVQSNFRRYFKMPEEEHLVNYYKCT